MDLCGGQLTQAQVCVWFKHKKKLHTVNYVLSFLYQNLYSLTFQNWHVPSCPKWNSLFLYARSDKNQAGLCDGSETSGLYELLLGFTTQSVQGELTFTARDSLSTITKGLHRAAILADFFCCCCRSLFLLLVFVSGGSTMTIGALPPPTGKKSGSSFIMFHSTLFIQISFTESRGIILKRDLF